MLVLAIDTATPAVTAGVLRVPDGDGAALPLAQRVTVDARAHAELLTPLIRAVLAEAGAVAGDLDAVVCGAGPGPFTGLRVGMVTAAAFGDALGIPVYPVCSLDAIAYEADCPVLVATDARRREVYWARYDSLHDSPLDSPQDSHGARGCVRVEGPNVARPAEVPTDGVQRAAGAAAGMLDLPVVAPEYPGTAGLVAVAVTELRAATTPEPLRPMYLRRPDAVEPGQRKRVLPA